MNRHMHQLWYTTETIGQHKDDLSDLSWVGGLPDEEVPWENGVEAPPRSIIRQVAGYWSQERDEDTLPDIDEAPEVTENVYDLPARRQRLAKLAHAARDRAEAHEKTLEEIRLYRRRKQAQRVEARLAYLEA